MAVIPDYPTVDNQGNAVNGFLKGNINNLTLGDIIGGKTGLLMYIYIIAGLILLVMLIMGGITLMTAAGDQNKTKQGYGMISSGLIGFLIIFISYFVAQIVQVALGVKFL